jgi:hypothetical protein
LILTDLICAGRTDSFFVVFGAWQLLILGYKALRSLALTAFIGPAVGDAGFRSWWTVDSLTSGVVTCGEAA